VAFIAFRDGVGGALLIDGRLYRGLGGAAGEVGYLVTSWPQDGDVRTFGASERHIAALLTDECESRGLDLTGLRQESAALIDLLRGDGGDLEFRPATRQALSRTIASILASITALLAPDMVVLSGWVNDLAEEHRSEIHDLLAGLVPSVPPIRASELGATATVVGAGIAAHRASTGVTELVQPR
jgi:predicted NBD/HSP70 family sugar kinase